MNNYDDIKRFKEKLNMEAIDYKEIAESNPNNNSHNWAIIKQVATADEPFQPLEHGLSTQPTPAPVGNKEFSALVSAPAQPTLTRAQPASAPPQQANSAAGVSPTPQDAGQDTFASPLLNALGKALPAASRAEAANAASPAAANFPNGAQAPHGAPGAIFTDKTLANNAPLGTIFPDNAMANKPSSDVFSTDNAIANTAPSGVSFADMMRQDPAAASTPGANAADTAPQAVRLYAAAAHFANAPQHAQAPSQLPPQPAAPVRKAGNTPGAMPFNKLFNRKSRQSAAIPGRDMPLSQLLENIALCR